MKHLLLMRHAKANIGEAGMLDWDRSLSERGKKDAPEMGKRIKQFGFKPDLIVSSPAKRTLKTAKAIAGELHYAEHQIQFEESIFDAHIEDVLRLIRNLPPETKNIILVGHNPAFTGLVGYLSSSFIEHLPTAGIALIDFDLPDWKLITQHSGNLVWFDFPKSKV
jgi:phosphohistidine phosphatase